LVTRMEIAGIFEQREKKRGTVGPLAAPNFAEFLEGGTSFRETNMGRAKPLLGHSMGNPRKRKQGMVTIRDFKHERTSKTGGGCWETPHSVVIKKRLSNKEKNKEGTVGRGNGKNVR